MCHVGSSTPTRDWTSTPAVEVESYPLDLQGSPPNLLLPEDCFNFPNLMEQTGTIFWPRPIVSSPLPFPPHRLAHVGQFLKPPAQWAAILDICAWHSGGLPGWLTPQPLLLCWARVAPQLVFMPLIKERHPSLAVSHADWTGKQLQTVKFNHSHFRKWDAGGGWFKSGKWGNLLFFSFIFLLMFDSTELNPSCTVPLLAVWSWKII